MEGVDHTSTADFVGKGDNHVVAALFRETRLVAGTGVFLGDGVTGGDVIGGGGALGGGDGGRGVTAAVDWLHRPAHRDGETAGDSCGCGNESMNDHIKPNGVVENL